MTEAQQHLLEQAGILDAKAMIAEHHSRGSNEQAECARARTDIAGARSMTLAGDLAGASRALTSADARVGRVQARSRADARLA